MLRHACLLPRPYRLLACLMLLGGLATAAAAQEAPPPWRTASLVGWREQLHLMIRDRRHAHGSLFFDRGLYRRFTPRMDHEYDLDVLTYGYTLQEDLAWYASPNGFRTYMGSIDRSHFVTQNQLRVTVPVRGRHTVRLHGIQQEDLTARRFFVEFGYDYRLHGAHRLGFTQTIASYKPDLDFDLFYAVGDYAAGLIRADVMLLDVANNAIFDGLGVDPVLEDTTRSYKRAPWLFALQLMSPPVHGVRAELTAGVQTSARALVSSQRVPENRFYFEDQTSYLGGLVEYRHRAVTVGLVYQRTFSKVRRTVPPGSNYTSHYRSRQAERKAMLYVLGGWRRLRGEAWVSREHYDDVQRGTDYDQATLPADLDYRERRTLTRLRLLYVPPAAGFRGGVEYLRNDRQYPSGLAVLQTSLLFDQWAPNDRFSVHAGYQFTPHAYIVLGASFDRDGDPFFSDRGLTRYDGGFARIALTW